MTVPYSFGTATSAIPLSQLDSNFNTPITLGNTAIQLGNTVTTLNNMTLANVTISSGSITIPYGNANAVVYTNSSNVATTSTALTFDGTLLGVTTSSVSDATLLTLTGNSGVRQQFNPQNSAGTKYNWRIDVNGLADQTWSLVPSTVVGGSTFSTPVYQANGNGTQIWSVGSSEAMRLTSTGLGIGTSLPGTKFQVNGGLATTGIVVQLVASSSGANSKIQYTDATTYNWTAGATGNAFTVSNGEYGTTAGTERMRIDSSGNLGLGVTPSAWDNNFKAFQLGYSNFIAGNNGGNRLDIGVNAYFSTNYKYANTAAATYYSQASGAHIWYNAPSGTAGNAITFTQAMTLDASGNLLLGSTSNAAGARLISENASGNQLGLRYTSIATYYLNVDSGGNLTFAKDGSERARIDSSGNLLVGDTANATGSTSRFYALGTTSLVASTFKSVRADYECSVLWSNTTTGNNVFATFATETALTSRGSITYNRAGGLVVYNTTSDYRAKTVNGPVQNALSKVALLKPSTGRMNGAEQDIDFFVAHELQEVVPFSVTGEKDAVNEDSTPKYQMVDKSALIPLLTAAIQEQQALITQLTERITALEGAK